MNNFKTLQQILIATVFSVGIFVAPFTVASNPFVSFDDVEWRELAPGVKMGVLWGDPSVGPHGFLIRFMDGGGMHFHPSDYWGVTIKGTWVHILDDGTEMLLPPGSYTFQPKDDVHADRCIGDEECVIYIHQEGPIGTEFVE
jgi:hypothetical protein